MSRQQAYSEVYQMLFTAYRKHPGSVSDIQPLADKHGLSSIHMASDLASLGVIQPDFVYSFTQLYCAISVLGMYQVDRTLINRWTSHVILGLVSNEGKGNISEYLNDEISEAQGVLDFARYLVGLGYIAIIEVNPRNRTVRCKLTHDGWREANHFA